MTRKVVNSAMVAHLWAAQTQDEANNAKNTISFLGTKLYSYAMNIANIIKKDDISVVLLNIAARNRSNSTSKHFGLAQVATKHLVHSYVVPWIEPDFGDSRIRHKENIDYLVSQYRAGVNRYERAIKSDEWNQYGRNFLLRSRGDVSGYCLIFDLEEPAIDYGADWARINARFERLALAANDPKKVAARAKREKKRLDAKTEQERLLRLSQLEALTEWMKGAHVRLPWEGFKTPSGGAYLRVKGDTLETSLGARVPLSEAVELFKTTDKLLSSMRIVSTFEINKRVGSFTVNCVYPNGDIKAGCHLIERAESVRIARELGLELSFFDNVTRALVHGN
jgi:hypothetical protein